MKLKNLKIWLALLLTLSVVAASFAGCAKKDDGKKDSESTKVTESADNNGDKSQGGDKTPDSSRPSGDNSENKADESKGDSPSGGSSGGNSGSSGSSPSGGSGSAGGNAGGSAGGNEGGNAGGSSGGNSGSGSSNSGSDSDVLPSDFDEFYDPSKAVLPEGITLSKISIVLFDGSPSLNVSVTNSTGSEKSVDFSYLVFKPHNGKEFNQYFGSISVKGNRTNLCSFPLDAKLASLKAGDTVDVYFGKTLIETVTVQ